MWGTPSINASSKALEIIIPYFGILEPSIDDEILGSTLPH